MQTEHLWKSRIAGYLTNFIDTMRLAGFKFEAQERYLRQFDQYCFDHNVPEAALPKEAVEDFCYGDEYQSQSTRQSRLCVLRKLAVYMEKSGCLVSVLPMTKAPRRPRYQPYIYTEKELRDFFFQIDAWDRTARSDKRWVVDSLLFRMLYGCGLRLMEALKLTVADVDLEEGILRIR
jgi:integrase